jgi:hypothetical protein
MVMGDAEEHRGDGAVAKLYGTGARSCLHFHLHDAPLLVYEAFRFCGWEKCNIVSPIILSPL